MLFGQSGSDLSARVILPVHLLAMLLSLILWAGFGTVAASAAAFQQPGFIATNSAVAASAAQPFATRKDESGWWLVAPDGQRFFSPWRLLHAPRNVPRGLGS